MEQNDDAIALAVVIRDGKVLIQQRFRSNHGMVYEFPGGSVAADETIEDAALRELREETGIQQCGLIETFLLQNQAGIILGFVILDGRGAEEPQPVNPARRQTFYWLSPAEIPVEKFMPADQEFIKKDLNKFLLP